MQNYREKALEAKKAATDEKSIAEEGSDTVLGVNDLVFGDQIHLAMEGIKLSGLSGDNIPKIEDYEKNKLENCI